MAETLSIEQKLEVEQIVRTEILKVLDQLHQITSGDQRVFQLAKTLQERIEQGKIEAKLKSEF